MKFSLLLYEEVPESRLQQIRNESFLPANASTNIGITFECRLTGQISPTISNSTPLATLTISVLDQGHSALTIDRIDSIKAVYRKLGQSFINKMVKRWLYEGRDFNSKKADNFVHSRNKRGKKKRKGIKKSRERKKEEKRAAKRSSIGQGQGPRPSIQPQMTTRGSYRPQIQQQTHLTFAQSGGSGFLGPRPDYSYGTQHGQFGGQFQNQGQGQCQGQNPFQNQYYEPPHNYYQQREYENLEPERILRNPGNL
jgi:hypothetical protein